MKQHFNRLLALLCAMVLTLGCAFAEPAASRTVITIDGVRTAFFDDAGNYLPAVEANGLLYAPVLALGANLGVAVTADANTLAVTLHGVRTAFFSPDGAYLSPILCGDQVYVPLRAFVENCGFTAEEAEGRFDILRQQATPTPAPTAAPTATPVPTAAPTQVPMYGYVPLSTLNYRDFFDLSTEYSHTSDSYKTSSFTIRHTVTISATTGFTPTNVRFSLSKYGSVTVGASGYATESYSSTIYKYEYGSDQDYIWGIANAKTQAILSGTPSVNSVSGKMRMSWHEAEAILSGYYEKAMRYKASGSYDSAREWLNLLGSVDYPGASDALSEIRKAEQDAAAAKRQRELDEQEQQYQAALALHESGKYPEAAEAFAALAEKKYKDSAARRDAALSAERQVRFDQADAAEKTGDTDTALALFTALQEEGFPGAGDRASAIWYARGEKAMNALDYPQAAQAFAAAGQYNDAAMRTSAAHYAHGEALLSAGDPAAAAAAFGQAGTYSDAEARILAAHYQHAEQLLASGDHNGAVAAFQLAGSHGDAADRIVQVHREKAMALLDAGDYDAALTALTPLSGDPEIDALISELPYMKVNSLIAAGQLDEAFTALSAMGTGERAAALRRQVLYLMGMDNLEENPGNARAYFSLSGYADAAGRVQESWYRQAVKVGTGSLLYWSYLENAGDYPAAREAYMEYHYQQGLTAYNKGSYKSAYMSWYKIRGYKDVDAKLAEKKVADSLKEILADSYVIGDILTFGSWAPVGGDGTKQPIEWIVVDRATGKGQVMLLSRYVLDQQPFDSKGNGAWAKSSLRTWLNNTFLKKAFTQWEQNAILKPSENTWYIYVNSDRNTDKVQCLSYRQWDDLYESASTRKMLEGWTVDGKPARYWDAQRCVAGAASGSYTTYQKAYFNAQDTHYVRPMITLNVNSSGIKWQSITLTDGPSYEDFSDRPHLALMQEGKWKEAADLLAKEKLNNNDELAKCYSECVMHLAAEALISGDTAAARKLLSDSKLSRNQFYFASGYWTLFESWKTLLGVK